MRRALLIGLLLALARPAAARELRGLVFDDANRDGRRSRGERGVANAVVAYGVERFAVTDAGGRFALEAPERVGGILWVRVPDGFAPGPVWARVDARSAYELALRPAAPRAGPLTFVVAADTHLAANQPFALDLRAAATDATAGEPAFFTILGDITQGNRPEQFALVDANLGELGVPYVPVPGNHDWYDGGAAWFAHYGPDNYSFDIGGVHFVVWNMAMSAAWIEAYLGAELARVAPEMTVVALTHAPPAPALLPVLRRLGVDYVLTGHTHSNRVVDHGGMIELTTEPLLMGGLDFTPGGYRVVTMAGGELVARHHSVVEEPVLAVIAPDPARCAAPAGSQLLVAAAVDAAPLAVTARIDCGAPRALSFAGGWSWRMELPALAAGRHEVAIEARSASGARRSRTVAIDVCEEAAAAASRGIAPPLATRWAAAVGGPILQASPVIADGAVLVTVSDLGDGRSGGVVALELATGAVRWRVVTPLPVRGAPAVAGDVVAIVQLDGLVRGVDLRSGAERWRFDLGAGIPPEAAAVFASPTADGHEVLIGNQRFVASIDARTGDAWWTDDPVPVGRDSQSLAAIAVGEGIAVGVFNRAFGGAIAWDRATGQRLWQYTEKATAINATPVIAAGTVYVVDGLTNVSALELASGRERWSVRLDPQGFDWGHATVGAPAIARGVLVVPTLYGELVALDAATGYELWRRAATPGPLRTTHYRGGGEGAFEASPVITDDIVWAADAAGVLTALELRTGRPLWRRELGAPVLAGLAVAGDRLIVASYDGSVRALEPIARERAVAAAAPGTCEAPGGGCCDAGGGPGAGAIAAVLAMWLRRRRRRRYGRGQPSTSDAVTRLASTIARATTCGRAPRATPRARR